jgi:hypothetical protein
MKRGEGVDASGSLMVFPVLRGGGMQSNSVSSILRYPRLAQ